MDRRAGDRAGTFGPRQRPSLRAWIFGVVLLLAIAGGTLPGCAISPADREAAVRAWAERDAERARECTRGRFIAGACVVGGGP